MGTGEPAIPLPTPMDPLLCTDRNSPDRSLSSSQKKSGSKYRPTRGAGPPWALPLLPDGVCAEASRSRSQSIRGAGFSAILMGHSPAASGTNLSRGARKV